MTKVFPQQTLLFNSPLETGVRSVVLLNAAYPAKFDLNTLTLLDHLVVHTADIGGPESLHPSLPQRTGELLVRRQIVESGLMLMRRLHLVVVEANDSGISYVASDEASSVVDLMRVKYAVTLKNRADWLIRFVATHGIGELRKQVSDRIDLWAAEFQEVSSPGGAML